MSTGPTKPNAPATEPKVETPTVATTPDAPATDAGTQTDVSKMTLEEQLKHFGPAPDGMRYLRVQKKLVIGQDGRPVTAPKSTKKKGRNKPSKPEYAVPVGKLRTSETPGFDVDRNKKLVEAQFHDPLDFAKWEVWFFEKKLDAAKKAVENLAKMGSTLEEREKAKEVNRAMAAMEKVVGGLEIDPNASPAIKAALLERLGNLFAKAQA